jgi:hypothetical protein
MQISQLFSAADATATQVSAPFQKGDLPTFSVQFTFSGASAGSVSLQCSNDNVNVPTNWITVSGSSVAIAAGESAMINVTNAGYRWVRASWVPSAGVGTVTADLVILQPANRF